MGSLYKKNIMQFSVEQSYHDFMRAICVNNDIQTGEIYSEIAQQLKEYEGSFIYFIGSSDLCVIHRKDDSEKITISKASGILNIKTDRTTQQFLQFEDNYHTLLINPDYIERIANQITLGNITGKKNAGATIEVKPGESIVDIAAYNIIRQRILQNGTARTVIEGTTDSVTVGKGYRDAKIKFGNSDYTVQTIKDNFANDSARIQQNTDDIDAIKRHQAVFESLTLDSPLSYNKFSYSPNNFVISVYLGKENTTDYIQFELSPLSAGSSAIYSRYYLTTGAAVVEDETDSSTYYNIYKQLGASTDVGLYLVNDNAADESGQKRDIKEGDEIILAISALNEDYITGDETKGSNIYKEIRLVKNPVKKVTNGVYAFHTGLKYLSSLPSTPTLTQQFQYWLWKVAQTTVSGRYYNVNKQEELINNGIYISLKYVPYAVIRINDFCSRIIKLGNRNSSTATSYKVVLSEKLSGANYRNRMYAAGYAPESQTFYGSYSDYATMDGLANIHAYSSIRRTTSGKVVFTGTPSDNYENNILGCIRKDITGKDYNDSMYVGLIQGYRVYNQYIFGTTSTPNQSFIDNFVVSPVTKSTLWNEKTFSESSVNTLKNGAIVTPHLFEETFFTEDNASNSYIGSWKANVLPQIGLSDTVSAVYSRAVTIRDMENNDAIEYTPFNKIYYSFDNVVWKRYNSISKISVPPSITRVFIKVPVINYTSVVGASPFFVLAPVYNYMGGGINGQSDVRYRGTTVEPINNSDLQAYANITLGIMNNIYAGVYSSKSASEWKDMPYVSGYFLRYPGIMMAYAAMVGVNVKDNGTSYVFKNNDIATDAAAVARMTGQQYAVYTFDISQESRATTQVLQIPYVGVMPAAASAPLEEEELELLAPQFDQESRHFKDTIQIRLTNPNPQGAIYYTEDGSIPSSSSSLYSTPITISTDTEGETITVRARVIYGTYSSDVVTQQYTKDLNFTISAPTICYNLGDGEKETGKGITQVGATSCEVSMKSGDYTIYYAIIPGWSGANTVPNNRSLKYQSPFQLKYDNSTISGLVTIRAVAADTTHNIYSAVTTAVLSFKRSAASSYTDVTNLISIDYRTAANTDSTGWSTWQSMDNNNSVNFVGRAQLKITKKDNASCTIYYTVNGEEPSTSSTKIKFNDQKIFTLDITNDTVIKLNVVDSNDCTAGILTYTFKRDSTDGLLSNALSYSFSCNPSSLTYQNNGAEIAAKITFDVQGFKEYTITGKWYPDSSTVTKQSTKKSQLITLGTCSIGTVNIDSDNKASVEVKFTPQKLTSYTANVNTYEVVNSTIDNVTVTDKYIISSKTLTPVKINQTYGLSGTIKWTITDSITTGSTTGRALPMHATTTVNMQQA